MKALTGVVAAIATCLIFDAAAQTSTPRALVESGTAACIKDGAAAAVTVWIKGSALEGNAHAVSQATSLRQVEDFYGKAVGSDVLRAIPLSPRSRLIYFTINFQKGALYARMQAYQMPDGGWVSTEFKFHTEAVNILPPSMTSVAQ